MQKKATKTRPADEQKKGFAGREVLAELQSEDLTGRFSLKDIRAAAASEALESELTAESVKDVLAAIPRPKSR